MTEEVAYDFTGDLLREALIYAEMELPVFPCHSPAKVGLCDCPAGPDCQSPGKHPRTIKGFKDATCDEMEIRRWWKMWPRANIGIAVPDGYVVLDIDGPDGVAALAEATGFDPTNSATPVADTGKGWHVWFTTDVPIPPRARILPQVDVRGPGSYVIAPPSLHVSGRQYHWRRSPAEVAIASAPDWLVELTSKPEVQAGGLAGSLDVATVLAGVAEGERDAALFRFASKLRYADVPYEAAHMLCKQAAENCTPPFPYEQMEKCLDSAYGRYIPSVQFESGVGEVELLARDCVLVKLDGPKGPMEFKFSNMEKTGTSMNSELSVTALMPGTSHDTFEQRLNLLSQSAREGARREMGNIFGIESKALTILLNRAIQEANRAFLSQPRARKVSDLPAPSRLEYIVNQFILDARPTILFGTGGSLKTFVLMSMMLCIAAGRDWAGRAVQKRNCLIVDYETRDAMTGYRMRMLARGLGLEDALDNIYWWDPDGIPIHELVDPLKRDIEKLNIGFVGLDHCGAACGMEPEAAESALRFYRAMSRLPVPVVALAHVTGSVADNPEHAKRPFGSIFWENGAGLTWFIQKEEQKENDPVATVGLFQKKVNETGRLKDFSLSWLFEDDRISFDTASLRASPSLMAIKGQQHVVWDALNQPSTSKDLAERVNLSNDRVRNILNQYKGMFERCPGTGSGGRGHETLWQRTNRFKETGSQTGSTSESYSGSSDSHPLKGGGSTTGRGEIEDDATGLNETGSGDLPWWNDQ